MIDWVAGVFELSGCWSIGNKKRIGFLLNIIGCLLWGYVAITKNVYGLFVVIIPAFFINLRNFIKWGNDEQKSNV